MFQRVAPPRRRPLAANSGSCRSAKKRQSSVPVLALRLCSTSWVEPNHQFREQLGSRTNSELAMCAVDTTVWNASSRPTPTPAFRRRTRPNWDYDDRDRVHCARRPDEPSLTSAVHANSVCKISRMQRLSMAKHPPYAVVLNYDENLQ
jgi:hypothetical protein